MPKLWTQTIETHRREVVDAILDTTTELVARHGLRGVTMSRIAEEAGIGRATLYKYFPDVEAILVAHHQRHMAARLAYLAELRDQAGDAGEALRTVLEALAAHLHHAAQHGQGRDLVALVHKDEHVRDIEAQLNRFLRDLLAQAQKSGHVRSDIAADELAIYCLHALTGAGQLSSKAAVNRLCDLTLSALHSRTSGERPGRATERLH